MIGDIQSRYEQAQSFLQGGLTGHLVKNDAVFPHWIAISDCFWYVREIQSGKEFRLVNANEKTNKTAFDHNEMADVLARHSGSTINYKNLPISSVKITLDPLQVSFQFINKRWVYDPESCILQEVEMVDNYLSSPNDKKAAYVSEYNLWILDKLTGNEKALTFDGCKDFSYGSSLILARKGEVQALWSPDSKKIFSIRLDTRDVIERPFVSYAPPSGNLHPQLAQIKNALPGDSCIETYQLCIADTDTGEVLEVDYPALPMSGKGNFFNDGLASWYPDSRHILFVDVGRGAKSVRVVKLDTYTGSTQVLFEESSHTMVRMCYTMEDVPLFIPLLESDELVWFSERSGWGHLYLYDLKTGQLKHAITEGEWLVREVLYYDASRRELIMQTAGRYPEINPYYCDICIINIDTGELKELLGGNFEHVVLQRHSASVYVRSALIGIEDTDVCGVSPSGQYLVATSSRVDTVPTSILLDRKGNEILTLENADISGLPENWCWPEPVKLKATDKVTDIYGVVFRPPGFKSDQKYPVIDFTSACRGLASVPYGSFVNGPIFDAPYLEASSLAALGFIVVAIEGRGTPRRNRAFTDHCYGDVAYQNDSSDHVSGLCQLAEYYPYMDLERVGIAGMDAFSTPVYSLLRQPDFYKVVVVQNYWESRYSFASLGESYDGIPFEEKNLSPFKYAEDHIKGFKGKLLLITGMMEFATPASTFQLVEALRKASKTFDMLCLPNLNTNPSSYTHCRTWNYLVEHLLCTEPPKDFQLITAMDWITGEAELPVLGSTN